MASVDREQDEGCFTSRHLSGFELCRKAGREASTRHLPDTDVAVQGALFLLPAQGPSSIVQYGPRTPHPATMTCPSTSQTSWALVLAAGWHADHPDKCDLPRRYQALAVPFLSVLDPFLSLARAKVVRKQGPGSWVPATATQVPRAATALRLAEPYVGPHFSLYPPFLPPPSPPSLPHRPHLLRAPCLTFTTGCTHRAFSR